MPLSLVSEKDDTINETARYVSQLDREEKELFLVLLVALPHAKPGRSERLEQYYKWHGSLTKEQKAAIPHEDHKRLLSALVLGEPFPEDLRQYWPEGYTW